MILDVCYPLHSAQMSYLLVIYLRDLTRGVNVALDYIFLKISLKNLDFYVNGGRIYQL